MLTKLGKACIGMNRISTGSQSFLGFATATFTNKCSKKAKDQTGTEKYLSMVPYSSSFSPRVEPMGINPGVYFGSGNTAPTEDDYTLENVITSGISVTLSPTSGLYGDYFYDAESNSEVGYISYTITNNGSSSVSISEIGHFCVFQTGSDYGEDAPSSATYRKLFLIDRTVLNAPLVIAPGSSAVLRYEIVFPGDDIV